LTQPFTPFAPQGSDSCRSWTCSRFCTQKMLHLGFEHSLKKKSQDCRKEVDKTGFKRWAHASLPILFPFLPVIHSITMTIRILNKLAVLSLCLAASISGAGAQTGLIPASSDKAEQVSEIGLTQNHIKFRMIKNHATQFREQENLTEGLRSSCFRYPVSKSSLIR
jgi:hypothetical protein